MKTENTLISRRIALSRIGGILATGLCPWPCLGAETISMASATTAPGLIDVHLHTTVGSPPEFTPDGTVKLGPFKNGEEKEGASRVAHALEAEMLAAGIGQALCMADFQSREIDPLKISEIERLAVFLKRVKLHPVGFADPSRTDRRHLTRVREILKQGRIKAFKAYLGYLPYGPSSPGYKPYYKLAEEFKIPVFCHTGDVALPKAKLKYCHPLLLDEVAVDYPGVTFVIAHAGNPWIIDAAEILMKNENVWLDLSALIWGTKEEFSDQETIKQWMEGWNLERVRGALSLSHGKYQKMMFGSDWPLVSLQIAVDFIKKAVPTKHHQDVFCNNAKRLFGL